VAGDFGRWNPIGLSRNTPAVPKLLGYFDLITYSRRNAKITSQQLRWKQRSRYLLNRDEKNQTAVVVPTIQANVVVYQTHHLRPIRI